MSPYQTATAHRLRRAATGLEVAALLLTWIALAYRATFYWVLPADPNDTFALAPLIDFALALVLFAVCLSCAGVGVAISLYGSPEEKGYAYRAFLIGVLCFVIYDLVYPLVPRLM